MKLGIHDIALDEIHELRKLVKQELAEQYKKTKPFRMEPVDNDTLLFIRDNMSSAQLGDLPDPNDPTYVGDMEYALETYGEDAVNQWLSEMQQMKQRRKL